MIGLHDHHRAHSTRVARTVEKTFASFSPGPIATLARLMLKSFNYFRHQFPASWDEGWGGPGSCFHKQLRCVYVTRAALTDIRRACPVRR